MATVVGLSSRLRAELGDLGRSFVENFTGDGITTRYKLSEAPISATGLYVYVNGVNVSANVSVELTTGVIIFATAPANNSSIMITGTTFRYFTDDEIEYYVNTAVLEHTKGGTDASGGALNVKNLPATDEYPVVILACSMALYTLATDAAFDIDIISPDGVSIPRSERFRQLMEMVQVKKEQYRELCTMLGTGLYRIEVFNLRRVSRRTNRYVPVYRPQEVDDGSLPQRIVLPIPSYGDVTPVGPAATRDLTMYSGDDFEVRLKFVDMDLEFYTPMSQIKLFPTAPANQVGPMVLANFIIDKDSSVVGGTIDMLVLRLDGEITAKLPRTAYWDIQLTNDSTGEVTTYLTGKVYTMPQVTTPNGN